MVGLMRDAPRVISLASALAALAASSGGVMLTADDASPESSDATSGDSVVSDEPRNPNTTARSVTNLETDLMSFTVHQARDGSLFPQHGSHVSHASHASHVSHVSGFGGGGGGVYVPYMPDVPSLPNPNYPPPAPAPAPMPAQTASPTTTPPPAAASDPKFLACTWASNGRGVTEIANELERRFGMSESQAASMSEQALIAVIGGGHFCDVYQLN